MQLTNNQKAIFKLAPTVYTVSFLQKARSVPQVKYNLRRSAINNSFLRYTTAKSEMYKLLSSYIDPNLFPGAEALTTRDNP